MREGNIPEQNEVIPKIDFKQIFDSKLESIKPLSDQDSAWESKDMQSVGITSVKRKDTVRFSVDEIRCLDYD